MICICVCHGWAVWPCTNLLTSLGLGLPKYKMKIFLYFRRLLWQVNEILHVKCLSHKKPLINVPISKHLVKPVIGPSCSTQRQEHGPRDWNLRSALTPRLIWLSLLPHFAVSNDRTRSDSALTAPGSNSGEVVMVSGKQSFWKDRFLKTILKQEDK